MNKIPGIALNEDNSHYFNSRAGKRLDSQAVASWVDQYAGTQVKELMLCPNAMRTSFNSAVWDPIWKGYDPAGKDDQPFFAGLPPERRKSVRRWVHTAWQLNEDKIDVYECWINRCRQVGISPWLSMRMNDVHDVNDEKCFMHSEFWRNHPEFHRVAYNYSKWVDKAFDYGQEKVRHYHMQLIRELAERYDFDGLELDWMRFGFHFKPGYESEGAVILTEFTAEVRRLLDEHERRRGHKIKLGARVPSRPQTALGLGMDAATWARQKLVQMLVITPFWQTIEPDMPVEIWKQLLDGTGVTLAAGLELHIRPFPASPLRQFNSLETVRGAAISLLDRGADRIYLFNYMDSDTTIDGPADEYRQIVREAGSLEAMIDKDRRHIMTYADTWATGEPQAISLPAVCGKNRWQAFRVHTGPKPDSGQVIAALGIMEGGSVEAQDMEVRVNGALCDFTGLIQLPKPAPDFPVYGFRVPSDAMQRGYNLIETMTRKEVKIGWAEFLITPKGSK
jgi:hypothetical protein